MWCGWGSTILPNHGRQRSHRSSESHMYQQCKAAELPSCLSAYLSGYTHTLDQTPSLRINF
jgi:hypothetical protein